MNRFLAETRTAAGGGGGGRTEPMSVEEVAMGFIRVANETMCRPIRSLTQVRLDDVTWEVTWVSAAHR